MALSQELLQAITNLQENAQARLPVLPNNGNPRGANNMPTGGNQPTTNAGIVPPSMTPQTQPTPKSPYAYPWLAPSASVDRIRNMLSGQVQQPVSLNQPQPISATQPMLPLLPARREGMY